MRHCRPPWSSVASSRLTLTIHVVPWRLVFLRLGPGLIGGPTNRIRLILGRLSQKACNFHLRA